MLENAENQNRLATATKQGDLKSIRELQEKIMRSFAARALAVRKVTSNRGRNTPGVDNVKWDSGLKKLQAVESLKDLRSYEPQPVRRIWIPKPGKAEKRPLGIPTLYDRAVQALIVQALEPVVESRADNRSFGFRRHRSVHDAIEYIRLLCASRTCKRHILEVDIRKFFDTISHTWLLEHIPINKNLLRKILKAGLLDLQNLEPTELGVPQGGVLSPCVANAALDGLEEKIQACEAFIVRYADDFVVASRKESNLKEALLQIEAFLKTRGLEVNMDKTRVTDIETGFDFLGFHLREYPDPDRAKGNKQGIFLVKPTRQNVVKICKKISETVSKHANASAGRLIMVLNPILRGWAEHYRTASSRTAFRNISNHVYNKLKKWVYKKHRRAGRRKGLHLYFKAVKSASRERNWIFTGENDRGEPVALFQIGNTSLCKHNMISLKQPKNPFLIEHHGYFQKRTLNNIRNSALLDKRKRQILLRQDGFCVHCGLEVQPQDTLEVHHVIGVKHGGSSKLSNLIVVHQNCHRQITNLEKTENVTGK